ncbi:MAG: 4Fe-4S ferredoxin [Chloroflexi bacterium]|nr:MAG: 4Fe-4S ferredoxin [Chloroflexota bacterium]
MTNQSNKIIKSSTVRFFKEGRKIQGYSFFDFLHGYFYARFPYLYIGIGTGEHPLAKIGARLVNAWLRLSGKPASTPRTKHDPVPNSLQNGGRITFADTYHGKVVPLEAAAQLVKVNEPVRLPNLEKIIPYGRARDIVLENPDHIVVIDCPCRLSRPDPCLPLDVCLIIGEPFVSFVLEHHPQHSRQITSEEAVATLRAEDKRGHVHHAFFKDAMLNRFYAICNCCSCCCGAMQAHNHGTPMLAPSGYECRVDPDLCIGCAECQESCQFGALSLLDGVTQVSKEDCMGCGVCVNVCPQGALELVREESKGEPLEIRKLMAQAER